MDVNDLCPTCGAPLLLDRENVPAPHYGRLVCNLGHYSQWAPAPMTFERAAAFIMPFGKYRGARLDAIPKDYLCWARENLDNQSIVRAIAAYLDAPLPGQQELFP